MINILLFLFIFLTTTLHTAENAFSSFTFKKLTQNDWPLMLQWFKEPHVEKWWPTPEDNELMEYFLEKIRSKNTFGFIVFLKDKPIGYIQYYYIDRSKITSGSLLPPLEDEKIVGIDQFIGNPEYLHKGYGTLFIKQFFKELEILEPNINTIILDPDQKNSAAIRCYEKIGFSRVCTYENPWGTSLLMKYDTKRS
jgi:RimJ/RimL family protein N-acetyltransferase